jgi:hypothetical protein
MLRGDVSSEKPRFLFGLTAPPFGGTKVGLSWVDLDEDVAAGGGTVAELAVTIVSRSPDAAIGLKNQAVTIPCGNINNPGGANRGEC